MILAENLKIGTLLINIDSPNWGTWKVTSLYDKGIWEIKGDSGEKCLFENDLIFWEIVN